MSVTEQKTDYHQNIHCSLSCSPFSHHQCSHRNEIFTFDSCHLLCFLLVILVRSKEQGIDDDSRRHGDRHQSKQSLVGVISWHCTKRQSNLSFLGLLHTNSIQQPIYLFFKLKNILEFSFRGRCFSYSFIFVFFLNYVQFHFSNFILSF